MPNVTGGMLLFGWERAREVVQAWREWTAGAPETATTSCRILQVPDMPSVPEFVRGRGIVVIDGAVLAGASEAAAILAPLRELRPELDTFAEVPPVALSHIHMDPRGSDALGVRARDAPRADRGGRRTRSSTGSAPARAARS